MGIGKDGINSHFLRTLIEIQKTSFRIQINFPERTTAAVFDDGNAQTPTALSTTAETLDSLAVHSGRYYTWTEFCWQDHVSGDLNYYIDSHNCIF